MAKCGDKRMIRAGVENGMRCRCRAIILMIGLFVLYFVSSFAVEAKDNVIRVGYIDHCSLINEANGEHVGYAVDYLNEISNYTGWKYEYVLDTWENCLEKLETGDIQLICMAEYMPENADKFLYADMPFGYEYTILYACPDSDIYYEEYEAMDGCKVGLLNEDVRKEEFAVFAREKGINYEPVYFDSEEEMLLALRNKEVKLAAVESLHGHGDLKMVSRFNVRPFYCATGKENQTLMNEINSAMQQIRIEHSKVETELQERYYGNGQLSCEPLFTREEYMYIEAAEPVVIKLMVGSRPLCYIKDGEIVGVFREFLDLISETSGITFVLEETTSEDFDEQTRQIINGDYITLRTKRAIEAIDLDEHLIASIPLVETRLAYVKNKENALDTGKTDYVFAITEEMNYLPPLLKKKSEDYKIQYYDSVQECLDAVLRKKADIAIQDTYVISYWLQKPEFAENLVECSGQNVINGLCFVASREQQTLVHIINKAINYLSSEDKQGAVNIELLIHPYEQTAEDLIYGHWEWLASIAIILVVAVYIYTVLLRRMTTMQVHRKDYEKLQKRVQQDELTGVYNRTYFYKKVREMVDNTEESMCIVLMDISNFKVVNDLYGMETGDKLLRFIAQELLRLGEKKEFIVSRFTGDHFYMCMRKADFYEIAFPRRFKTFLEDIEIKVTYGVFMIEDQRDIPVNIMCDRANMAAHDKERQKLEYIRYYSDEERMQMLREQEIENDMEKALEARQFCVYIQPKYDVREGKIVGGEALARWIHPSKGMVPPVEFISIFERNGFILRLDYYMWEETCRLLAKLKEKGLGGNPISINVSRAHFYGVELQEKLQELIAKYQLLPQDLELEITETICAEDPDIIYKKIKDLQEAGFKVAMDDFGSGYSSLNMLKEMPLDIIKMDLKFLDGGDNEEKSRNILQTLITLAHSIGLSVVVEGVETNEQVEFLRGIGSYYVQGYYFSRPVDCETYETMLTKERGLLNDD